MIEQGSDVLAVDLHQLDVRLGRGHSSPWGENLQQLPS
jgi:hypothetical protein